MKKLMLIASVGLLAACAYEPIPADIKAKVDKVPANELPTDFMAERDLCGGYREKKAVCRERVRRESLAREMMREQDNYTQKKGTL